MNRGERNGKQLIQAVVLVGDDNNGEKMRNDSITPQEHQELLTLIESIDQFHANRLQKLIELAQYHGGG